MKKKLLAKYFRLMMMQRNMDEVWKQYVRVFESQIETDLDLTPEQRRKMEKLMDTVRKRVMAHFQWKHLREEYMKIYAEVYSVEDLSEMIRFYSSPVGRKTVETIPLLKSRTLPVLKKRVDVLQPEINTFVEQSIDRIRAMGD